MLDVKISGWRRASSMSTLRLRMHAVPSRATTGLPSRMDLKTGWGLAAMSASASEEGRASSSVPSVFSVCLVASISALPG